MSRRCRVKRILRDNLPIQRRQKENSSPKQTHGRRATEPGDLQRQGRCLVTALYKSNLKNERMFQSLKLIHKLPPIGEKELVLKLRNLPRLKKDRNKKTLIFDLDETLVHQVEESAIDNNVSSLPGGFHIKVRPYVNYCLEQTSKHFELIVFTASHPTYADAVIDFLDPLGSLFSHRLYREDCIPHQGAFVKDLRVINRNIEDVAIVDNSVWSFASQIDNGIPIQPWTGDQTDTELLTLVEYSAQLLESQDVRETNRSTFNLNYYK